MGLGLSKRRFEDDLRHSIDRQSRQLRKARSRDAFVVKWRTRIDLGGMLSIMLLVTGVHAWGGSSQMWGSWSAVVVLALSLAFSIARWWLLGRIEHLKGSLRSDTSAYERRLDAKRTKEAIEFARVMQSSSRDWAEIPQAPEQRPLEKILDAVGKVGPDHQFAVICPRCGRCCGLAWEDQLSSPEFRYKCKGCGVSVAGQRIVDPAAERKPTASVLKPPELVEEDEAEG